MSDDKKKLGLTSEEAAALWLSDGKTSDPVLASMYDQESKGLPPNFDAAQRQAFRNSMGFDFKVKQAPNYFYVMTEKVSPQLSTRARIYPDDVDDYGNVINSECINRLVDACVRLKRKYDQAQL